MKRTLSALAIALASLLAAGTARAQTALEEIEADRLLSAHNYRAYPVPDTALSAYPLTPAPEGYEPFYISTFARHGSRYLTDMDDYLMPLHALRRADSLGVLTPLGRQALAVVDSMARMARGRIGELTPRGARQHRGIAGRMYRNFPQVFAAGAHVHARSTQVPRVMLSMLSQCLRLQALNPSLAITNSASERDLAVLTPPSTPRVDSIGRLPLLADVQRRFQARHLRPARLMGSLFTDPAYAAAVDSIALMRKLFSVAAIMQSHDTGLELLSLFTPRECYELWRCNNLAWYLPYCNSPLTHGLMPFRAARLLLDLLDCASQALADGVPAAHLRFGHDGNFLPLAALLELDDWGRPHADPETLDADWRGYRLLTMACNIQLVFYRNPHGGDTLLKVLLNEREARLPLPAVTGPYYRWADVEAYYRAKLAAAGY